MIFKNWEPIYKEIISDFSFSEHNDMISSELLNSLLQKHPNFISLSSFSTLISNKTVVIIGAGSQVSEIIKSHREIIKENICITADGATTALLKQKIIPEIIVTDLDGNIEDQIYANKKGSILVVHAHGDNIQTIRKFVPIIPKAISGTIQSDPLSYNYVSNIGGFTDGDRSVFLAEHFKPKSIYLIGFDFHGPIGKFSCPKNKNLDKKRKKLLWAEKLISLINKNHYIHFLE